ncbi:MAG: hypothetical protein JKY98_00010 [Gammaproteobacteria bacterium]|nr:hypothetical protein [Gammaproteobacteria bacterium]
MNLLVVYARPSTHVLATLEYLQSFSRYWEGEVRYVHVVDKAVFDVDLSKYQVLFHSYCARLCFEGYVTESYRSAVMKFAGLKILSVQDEYDRTDHLKREIHALGFDVVLTTVPQHQIELVYPKEEFPNVTFVTVLTGYVADWNLEQKGKIVPLQDRPIAIGYRGRNIGVRYGQLGFDKYEIGRRMKEVCAERDICTDIEMDAESRIYGEDWPRFIRSCRTMLGSESGSNVFDFDGEVEREFSGLMCDDPDASAYLKTLAPMEEPFDIGQISPRVFECAVSRTPMVLYEGSYSGAIEPGEHYISLKKDFSNIEQVLDSVNNIKLLSEMAERSFKHLILSGDYTYRSFVGSIQEIARAHSRTSGDGRKPDNLQSVASFSSQLLRLPYQSETLDPKEARVAETEQLLEVVLFAIVPTVKQRLVELFSIENVGEAGIWKILRQKIKLLIGWARSFSKLAWRVFREMIRAIRKRL